MNMYSRFILALAAVGLTVTSGIRFCQAVGSTTITLEHQHVDGSTGDSYMGGETLSCGFRIFYDNSGVESNQAQDWKWSRCFDAVEDESDLSNFTPPNQTGIKIILFFGIPEVSGINAAVTADANKSCMDFWISGRNGTASNWEYKDAFYSRN